MRKTPNRAARVLLIVAAGGTAISMLFWAKLKLITQIPRTTYADEEPAAEPKPADSADQSAPEIPRSDESDRQRTSPEDH
ncbi:MAG: hypothetical protein H6811_09610 [Phycisphaeraceae bacterium]|nr:hypothetical protein [Phycisphaeraceae bacterium]